jgi:hypothetical protein
VLIIGAGDLGERLAAGLGAGGSARRLVVASRSADSAAAVAAAVGSASDCLAEPATVDARQPEPVAELLARVRPDLVVQCASLRGPYALAGRDDPAALAVAAAGFGLRLPYQLPVILAVMRAARDAGYRGPVANLSFPDATGPVLARLGLAPALGLGNAGLILLRVRAVLRAAAPGGELPLVRVVAAHAQLPGVMRSREPASPGDRCRVYLGAAGKRDDGLGYAAPPIPPGPINNLVTAAAALPVIEALLPGAAALRWSVPAPDGLPGGYPARIGPRSVTLDLPPGLTLAEAVEFNERAGRNDGIERIEPDGTVVFTEQCREAVAGLAPDLADPLPPGDLAARAARLDAVLGYRSQG